MTRQGRGRWVALAAAGAMAGSLTWVGAQEGTVALDADDIGGVVASANGPEAGVWVIAETTDLPTRFARVVVTDDAGRYLVPDLPDAGYEVWVRGYGLLDSERAASRPGRPLDLRATVAPDAASAAQAYPAAWWLTMIEPPEEETAQLEFALTMKQCYDCHQVGNKATREILPLMQGRSGSSLDVWTRRTAVGPSGPGMASQFRALGDMRQALADWTDRIAAGEAPTEPPPRPPRGGAQPGDHALGLGLRDRRADGHGGGRHPRRHGERERPRLRRGRDDRFADRARPRGAPFLGGEGAVRCVAARAGLQRVAHPLAARRRRRLGAPGRRPQLGRRRPRSRLDGIAPARPRRPARVSAPRTTIRSPPTTRLRRRAGR